MIVILQIKPVKLTDKIPMSELAWPDNNFVASPILSRLLDAILELDGQLISPTSFCGPLNTSIYVCSVRDANAAAKTIWSVLGEISLVLGVKIFRFDDSEDVLRCMFPASGDACDFDELLRTLHIAEDLTTTAMARANQITRLITRMQQLKKPGDDIRQ